MINIILNLYHCSEKVMLYNILKHLPICNSLVSIFVGTIAYVAAIFIFIVQHFNANIKDNNTSIDNLQNY